MPAFGGAGKSSGLDFGAFVARRRLSFVVARRAKIAGRFFGFVGQIRTRFKPDDKRRALRRETLPRRKIDADQFPSARNVSPNEKFRRAVAGRNIGKNAADHRTSSANTRLSRRTPLRSARRVAQSARASGGQRDFRVLMIRYNFKIIWLII